MVPHSKTETNEGHPDQPPLPVAYEGPHHVGRLLRLPPSAHRPDPAGKEEGSQSELQPRMVSQNP